MDTFILKLKPELTEELFADISSEFLSFVIIEALFNIVQCDTVAGNSSIVDDPIFYCDDPDRPFDDSVAHLLQVMADQDKMSGVVLPGEFYEYNSEFHEQICNRLSKAIDVIRDSNDYCELFMIRQVFRKPEYQTQLNFATTYYSGRVVFSLSSPLSPLPAQ